jgi:hypothetical protein
MALMLEIVGGIAFIAWCSHIAYGPQRREAFRRGTERAMRQWEDETCLRLTARENEKREAARLVAERHEIEESERAAARLEANRAENEAAKLRLSAMREEFQRSIAAGA